MKKKELNFFNKREREKGRGERLVGKKRLFLYISNFILIPSQRGKK